MVESQTSRSSTAMVWTGRVISSLVAAMLMMSATMKFAQPKEVIDGMVKAGWTQNLAFGLGIVEAVCTILYLIPQTTVLGAILLTGYLGGATATHVRVGESFAAPVIVGVFVWLGLFLREPRLRALLPFRW